MPEDIVRSLVDPSVSPEEIELALHGTPTVYADVRAAADSTGNQDTPAFESFTAADQTPRTIHDALANLKRMRDHHIPIGGVNLCLFDTRENAWGVNALWPTAEAAGQHGAPIHRFKSFADAPRGMSLIFENDDVWHIGVGLGGGLMNSSDYHEAGYNGVATIENVYPWCGAHDWYGIEVVNDVDCWNPKPPQKPTWTKARLIEQLKQDRARAKANGHTQKVAGLTKWIDELEASK